MLPHPAPGESAEEHAGTHAASLDPPKRRGMYVHILSATNQELQVTFTSTVRMYKET